jgi:DNA-binding transcriptional MocR family regulator
MISRKNPAGSPAELADRQRPGSGHHELRFAERLLETQGSSKPGRNRAITSVPAFSRCLQNRRFPSRFCKATKVSVSDLVVEVAKAACDPGLVRLGAAVPNPELLPMQQLNRAMNAIGRGSPLLGTGYDAPPGAAVLRNQIARRVVNQGWTLFPEEIVTTCGGQEAVNLCLRAVAKASDTIALESPT